MHFQQMSNLESKKWSVETRQYLGPLHSTGLSEGWSEGWGYS